MEEQRQRMLPKDIELDLVVAEKSSDQLPMFDFCAKSKGRTVLEGISNSLQALGGKQRGELKMRSMGNSAGQGPVFHLSVRRSDIATVEVVMWSTLYHGNLLSANMATVPLWWLVQG